MHAYCQVRSAVYLSFWQCCLLRSPAWQWHTRLVDSPRSCQLLALLILIFVSLMDGNGFSLLWFVFMSMPEYIFAGYWPFLFLSFIFLLDNLHFLNGFFPNWFMKVLWILIKCIGAGTVAQLAAALAALPSTEYRNSGSHLKPPQWGRGSGRLRGSDWSSAT